MSKAKIGIFGNCQAAEIARLLTGHVPFSKYFHMMPIKPVHDMSMADRAELLMTVRELDVLVYQPTSSAYAPASTEKIQAVATCRMIAIPSMWFSGHLPDVTYFDGAVGAPSVYHSVIIASAFAKGLSETEAVQAYETSDSICTRHLEKNYAAGIAELQRREKTCDVTLSDYIILQGSSERLFHTMNHPVHGVILHVANQVLDLLKVPRMGTTDDALGMVRWPLTEAVARTFGVSRSPDFTFGSVRLTLPSLVKTFYDFSRSRPEVMFENRARLHPAWLLL